MYPARLVRSSQELEILAIPVTDEDLDTPCREVAVDSIDADLSGTPDTCF